MIKINGTEIKQNHFPDNTLLVKAETHPYEVSWIEWNYENDAELFTLICLVKHYHAHTNSKKQIDLYLPYCPHARMDRVKNIEDVFTLKYFAEVINSLNFNQVVLFDVHSNVAPALIDRCVVEQPDKAIKSAIEQSGAEAICYPDEGAMKRYSSMAPLPYAFCIKKRDWETGKIEGLDLQNADAIKGKNVLIVDDICSRGGTFYYTAKALKEAGAKSVSLYVSHLEETVFDGELYKEMYSNGLIKKIYTTNSIYNYIDPNIVVVSNV